MKAAVNDNKNRKLSCQVKGTRAVELARYNLKNVAFRKVIEV